MNQQLNMTSFYFSLLNCLFLFLGMICSSCSKSNPQTIKIDPLQDQGVDLEISTLRPQNTSDLNIESADQSYNEDLDLGMTQDGQIHMILDQDLNENDSAISEEDEGIIGGSMGGSIQSMGGATGGFMGGFMGGSMGGSMGGATGGSITNHESQNRCLSNDDCLNHGYCKTIETQDGSDAYGLCIHFQLYIVDGEGIKSFHADGTLINTIEGRQSGLDSPYDLEFFNQSLYVSDSNENRLIQLQPDGTYINEFQTSEYRGLNSLAKTDTHLILNYQGSRHLVEFEPLSGQFRSWFSDFSFTEPLMVFCQNHLFYLLVNSIIPFVHPPQLYIRNIETDELNRLGEDLAPLVSFTVSRDGVIYVAERDPVFSESNGKILRFRENGQQTDEVLSEILLGIPRFMRFGPDGYLYISSATGVHIYDVDQGTLVRTFAQVPVDAPLGYSDPSIPNLSDPKGFRFLPSP